MGFLKTSITMTKILLSIVLTIMMNNCTDAPSGAIEYSTTVYYLNDRFHEDIPEDFIFKTWGYRIRDAVNREHTYKNKISIPHNRKQTHWCSIHRQSEVIKAHYDVKLDGYYYWITRHKKSL